MRAHQRSRAVALSLVLLLLLITAASVSAKRAGPLLANIGGLPVARIGAGSFTPLYRPTDKVKQLRVAAFWLMTRPVTNGELLGFVTEHAEFQRGTVATVFADSQYLAQWRSPVELGSELRASQPATQVSWFVARAFCEAHGMRLPEEAEWELAAAASATQTDGSRDTAHQKAVLDWYTKPRSELPDVPHGPMNVYGVQDLHGVIWEWVEDFNNAVVVADSREQGDATRNRFCGASALVAQDTLDYAAFMRVALRSSLEANYTGAILGFRCAADASARLDPPR